MMLRTGHKDSLCKEVIPRFSSKTGQEGSWGWQLVTVQIIQILPYNPSPVLRFHSFTINILSHQAVSSIDLVIQQPQGSIILYLNFLSSMAIRDEVFFRFVIESPFLKSRTQNSEFFVFFKLSSNKYMNTLEATSPCILLFIH